MPNVPPELITDILTRLPVKSLLRFRCVSKPWCRLIDSTSFTKLHLNRSLRTDSNLHVILGFLGIYSIDLDSPECAVAIRPPFSASDISNSCNGLVLVFAAKPFLWNPFTGKYRELPPNLGVEHPGAAVSSPHETFGFAYDSKNDDYVVVRVMEFRGVYLDWIGSEASIYSCKSDSWRRIGNFPYQLPYKRVWGVHLNGVLHTATRSTSGDNGKSIMGFNVGSEQHLRMPKPEFRGGDGEFSVEVLGGCLCLVRPRRKHRTDIWVMKEYGVKESWSMLLSIAPPVVDPYVSICPIAFSKDGLEVLLNHDDKRLIWYHLKEKSVRNLCVDGLPFVFYGDVCVASLVRPDALEKVDYVGADVEEKTQSRKSSKKREDDFLSEGFKLVL